MRLVGDNVEIGIYSRQQALDIADELGSDLVEISPNATPPVCKVMDYKKFVYEQKKREKALKANSVVRSERRKSLIPPAPSPGVPTDARRALVLPVSSL